MEERLLRAALTHSLSYVCSSTRAETESLQPSEVATNRHPEPDELSPHPHTHSTLEPK
jgi:hypothetical protein